MLLQHFNPVKTSLPFAIRKKNRLFTDSKHTGQRTAIIQTLLTPRQRPEPSPLAQKYSNKQPYAT